jgi:hypothetical protein
MNLYQTTVPCVLPSGESADFSWWMTAADDAGAVAAVDAYYVSLAGNATFKALYTTSTQFSQAKVSRVDMASGIVDFTLMAGTAFTGLATSSPLPPQVATAVTLNTAIVSRRTRGRYYLPAPITAASTTLGRILSGDQTTIANAIAAAHHVANAAGTALVVYSRAGRSVQDVTTIAVGDVFDTIRTRRDKLIEVYANVSV